MGNYLKINQKWLTSLVVIICLSLPVSTVSGARGNEDSNSVGWASVNRNMTGSNDENPMTVTTADELKSAMKTAGKVTIYIKGDINIDGQIAFDGITDKTIYGLSGSKLVNSRHSENKKESGILMLKNCRNIILRNLTFQGAGAYDIDGNDNLTLSGCEYIWVDHCDFQDGVDGNLDCNNGTDHVSITWCRFRYLLTPWGNGSGGADDHRYSNLIGSSDKNAEKDEGRLRITYANCWWDEGCRERMPRIRFGQVHIVNCLYSSSVSNYCIGTGYRCNAYVEKCVFINQKNPWKNYATSGSYTDYNITVTDCVGAKDEQSNSGNIEFFNPYAIIGYNISTCDKEQTEERVRQGAGATLPIEEGEPYTTGTYGLIKYQNQTTEHYTLSGVRISKPAHGLYISVSKDAKGTANVKKSYKRTSYY